MLKFKGLRRFKWPLLDNCHVQRFASAIRTSFMNGDRQQALEQFYGKPNSFDGSFLISKLQNIDEGFRIYQSVAERNMLEIPIIVSLIVVCSTSKQENRALNLWSDLVMVLENNSTQQKLNKITSFEWNLIVNGLCRMGRVDMVLKYVMSSDLPNMKLTSKTLTNVLNSCCSFGYLDESLMIINEMKTKHIVEPDVVHYTCLIKGFCNAKRMKEALSVLHEMQNRGISPNEVTLLTLTNGFIESPDRVSCEKLRQIILKDTNYRQCTKLLTNLLRMLAKCGRLSDAEDCFKYLCENSLENEITFNSMIEAYGEHKRGHQALQTFYDMISEGYMVSEVTMTIILDACIENDLVDHALQIFNSMEKRYFLKPNIIHYTCMIKGLAKRDVSKCLDLLKTIQLSDIQFDDVLFVTLCSKVADNGNSELAEYLNEMLSSMKSIQEMSDELVTALINMNGKCNSLGTSIAIFENRLNSKKVNIIIYSAMINVYGLNGKGMEALELFHQMLQDNIQPNSLTFLALLNACSQSGMITESLELLSSMKTFNISPDISHYNCLMKCFVKAEKVNEAIRLLEEMEQLNIKPNEISFILLCGIVADTAAISVSKTLHHKISEKLEFLKNIELLNALMNMHVKCGSIDNAISVFETCRSLKKADVISYTTMIYGYGLNGMGKEALLLFNQMEQDGVQPNSLTIVAILNALGHCGMVDETLGILHQMNKYNIPIETCHINCIVDALSKNGSLDQAEEILSQHSTADSFISLVSLLAGCRKFNDLPRAERIFKKISKINAQHAGSIVMMANIYSNNKLPEKAQVLHKKMSKPEIIKIPGQSFVEIHGKIHSFYVEDCKHPEIEEIYKEWLVLNEELIKEGYIPNTKSVHRIDLESEEEKQHLLWRHCEKIAVTYALMKTSSHSTPITLTSNLKICEDCHQVMKLISKIRKRQIHVRDANRFHHFKDGHCSCHDHW